MPTQRTTRRDLLALLTLCALTGFFGLTDHGVTNWQEGIRLLAAQEMHQSGDWLVPTIHGIPYLAKPPLVYWGQLALSPLTGGKVTLATLRLLVALAGTLSVVLLYLFVKRALADPDQDRPDALSEGDPRFASAAAFWSAACLATSILFVRNMRIGELDILIVPPAIATVWAVYEAWRTHETQSRVNWGAVSVACAGTALCALAKGPPGMLTPLLAAYGAIALRHAYGGDPSPSRARAVTASVIALAAFVLSARAIRDVNDAVGAVFFAGATAFAALTLGRLCARGRGWPAVLAWSRTHPVGAAAAGALVLWAWSAAVNARIGAGVATSVAEGEAAENLQLLVLEAPARTIEFLGYAGGLGSVACLAGFVWLAVKRPRLGRAGWIAIAWAVLPLIAFSCLGKGVQRYLLPTLPGMCAIGGLWIAHFIAASRRPTLVRAGHGLVIVALALGQGYWYGRLRDERAALRSPRDLVAELAEKHGFDPERLASLDLWTPALDVYCGAPVVPYYQIDPTYDFPHPTEEAGDFVRRVREDGGRWTVFVRAEPNPRFPDKPRAADRLAELGLVVQELPTDAPFATDKFKSPVVAVRVWWPE